MEIDLNKSGAEKALNAVGIGESIIKVKANLSCPSCSYNKKFRNQFHLKDIEQMVVSIKCFDWLTCPHDGDLMTLNLDFEI